MDKDICVASYESPVFDSEGPVCLLHSYGRHPGLYRDGTLRKHPAGRPPRFTSAIDSSYLDRLFGGYEDFDLDYEIWDEIFSLEAVPA